MPCESLESIAITPRSCSSPSAAIVCGAHAVAHDRRVAVHAPGREHVHGRHHREVLGLGVHAERHRRRRRGGEDALAPGQRERVGPVPAAAALDVEGVPRAAGGDGDRVLDREQLVHAVGVHGELHVVGVGESSAQRSCSGPAPTSSWILSPPPPARSAVLDRARARRGRAHEQAGVERMGLERGPGRAQALLGVAAEVPGGPVVLDHERRQPAGERRVADLRREPVHVASRCRPASPRGRARRSRPSRCRARRRSRPSCRGCPARPTATTRPSATPMLVRRTPSTGSSSRTSVIASATPPRSARTARPSRIVPPMPAAMPLASSRSASTSRPVSPSARAGSGTEIPPLARELQRPLARARRVERAVDEPAVAAHDAQPGDRHAVQLDASRPARSRAWRPASSAGRRP